MRHLVLLFAAAFLVLFLNLGGPRLWDRDEPRNAGCAAEMLQRADWVTPMFNGELRDHKPVLLYWFMMVSYVLFGVNEFAARLPSALLAVGTVWMVYLMGRRMFSASAGLWSGIILTSTLMFGVAGRAATPDSVLIFFTTLATTLFVLATFPCGEDEQEKPDEYPQSWWTIAAIYLVMGIAMLGKGPVGLVLPTAVLGMYLLIRWLPKIEPASTRWQATLGLLRPFAPRHFLQTCWRMRPITAILISLAIALPWYIWVGIRTDGAWPSGFFLQHNVGRAMQSMEGHGGSIAYYPLAILVGFFPWSVFLVPLLIMLVRQFRGDDSWNRGATLAICWVAVYLVLFSIASTKLPSYITPCYPGAALLFGCFADRWMRGHPTISYSWMTVALSVTGVVGVAMLVGVPIAAAQFLPGGTIIAAIGLVPLTTAAVALWYHLQRRPELTVKCFAAGSVALTATAFGLVSLELDSHQKQHELLRVIGQRSTDATVGSYACLEPSWVFYLRQPVIELQAKSSGAAKLTREHDWQPRPRPGLEEFLSRGPGHFVITTERARAGFSNLPLGVVELADVPYFLKSERLVLLGWIDKRSYVAANPGSRVR